PCRHSCPADARRGKARSRRLLHRYRIQPCLDPGRGGATGKRPSQIACCALASGPRSADTLLMREIVFDTETTGLDPLSGDRMVEIGCIELINRVATGRTFHAYFNPDRSMPLAAEQVHGLSDAFLSDKQRFHERVVDLLHFLGDAP